MINLLKMGIVLAAILVLVRRKVPLSATLAGSSLVLAWMFGMSIPEFQAGLGRALFSLENLYLILILELVLLFSALLKDNGCMGRAIAALNRLFRDARITVALIPAVIGLLPVVGGAMLSAPLVAEASDELGLSPERRTFINYWFRHIWEYTMPTFAAVFLTASIVGISIPDLVLANSPLTLAAIVTGAFFGFRGVSASQRPAGDADKREWGTDIRIFLVNLAPFFLVIGLTLFFHFHLFYSLALVTVGTVVCYRIPPAAVLRLSKRHMSLDLAFLIWGMMLFKEILLSSGAMVRVTGELTGMGMPPVLLVMIVPALIALITGYAPAVVGLGFPVLLPILQAGPSLVAGTMLAVASGICAHMLSPMHACYIMTLQYNRASMAQTYRIILAPALLTFLTGLTLYILA
jgi:integral membrane protein (TIGR00529 family)